MKPTIWKYAECGLRDDMQDQLLVGDVGPGSKLLSVFDGHGGDSAAVACRAAAPGLVAHALRAPGATPLGALSSAFRGMQAEAAACPGEVGTTASLALLTGRRRLAVATCGDSLCVLYADAGADRLQGRVLTASHRLSSNPDEQRRIRDIEPWAVTCFGGEQRVCGALNMSRSLGDAHLHPFVTHDPELWEGVLTPADRYLVLATDGVWDVLGPDAVGDLLARARGRIRERGDAARADLARLVCRAALRAGSRDNVAAVVADPLAP